MYFNMFFNIIKPLTETVTHFKEMSWQRNYEYNSTALSFYKQFKFELKTLY